MRDITVVDYSTIVLLWAHTRRGLRWMKEHTAGESIWWGRNRALVCEPRYIPDIINGATEDGLEVQLCG